MDYIIIKKYRRSIMKYNKLISISSAFVLGLATTSVFANKVSVSLQNNSSSQWGKTITINNVTSKTLGVKEGDEVTVTAPQQVKITSHSWGSMKIGDCHKVKEQPFNKTAQFECTVKKINGGKWWKPTKLSWYLSFKKDPNSNGSKTQTFDGKFTISNVLPQNNGTVELKLPKKPSYVKNDHLPEIIINHDGNPVAKIDNKQWGQTIKERINFKNRKGTFSINVPDIQQNQGNPIKGQASPSQFRLTKDNNSQKVTISYQKPKPLPKGRFLIKIHQQGSGTVPETKPHYEILNKQGNEVASGQLSWAQSGTTTKKLAAKQGNQYTLEVTPSFFENDIHYQLQGSSKVKFTLEPNKTKTISTPLKYKSELIKPETIHVNIKGLPKNQTSTITFTDTSQSPNDKEILRNVGNGEHSIKIPLKNHIWKVTASEVNDLGASVEPEKFTADQKSRSLSVNYQKFDFYAPYKDATIHLNWNSGVISTRVNHTGKLEPLLGTNDKQPSQLDPKNKAMMLGFVTGQCGQGSWAGFSTSKMVKANFSNDKDNPGQFVRNNTDYVIATGGVAGAFTCNSQQGMDQFISQYESKNFKGIDLDIEQGAYHGDSHSQIKTKVDNLLKATAEEQKARQEEGKPLHVTLTVASFGKPKPHKHGAPNWPLNWLGGYTIQQAREHGLKFDVNLMTMNFGTSSCILRKDGSGECNMAASSIAAAKSLHKQYDIPFNRIALTPMIGENDVAKHITTHKDITKIADFAKNQGLAGLHYWSFDRDTTCRFGPAGAASPICNHQSKGPQSYNEAIIKALQS